MPNSTDKRHFAAVSCPGDDLGVEDPEVFPAAAAPGYDNFVTSKTGAALQDIRNVIGRRWPAAKLLLCPVNVQGFEAAQQVADAIGTLDKSGRVDEIIVSKDENAEREKVYNTRTYRRR